MGESPGQAWTFQEFRGKRGTLGDIRRTNLNDWETPSQSVDQWPTYPNGYGAGIAFVGLRSARLLVSFTPLIIIRLIYL